MTDKLEALQHTDGWVRYVFENLTQAKLAAHDVIQAFFALLGSAHAITVAINAAPTHGCLEQAC